MIDRFGFFNADKYEGHTEGKWNVLVSSEEDITQAHLHDETAGYYFFSQGSNREQEENYNHNESRANARLMSDSPLLLAEVMRLRKELDMRIALIAEVDTMIGAKWNVSQDDWNELVNKHYIVERIE
tara:strand:+ start:2037 stop:2417 length:381 start_codon:yes stop_codon:yes gene_type:complete